MAITQLERPSVQPVLPAAEPCLTELVAGAEEALILAAGAPTGGLDDEALAPAVAALAGIESRAAALRLAEAGWTVAVCGLWRIAAASSKPVISGINTSSSRTANGRRSR